MPNWPVILNRDFLANYRSDYNRLIDVEDADSRLHDIPGSRELIRAALAVIAKHKANAYCGLSLLHRHFSGRENQVFVERTVTPRTGGHRTLFVTTAEDAHDAPRRMAPWRFKLDRDGGLTPLEFTTDRAAIGAYPVLHEAAPLRRELARLLFDRGAQDVLGIGIYARTRSVYGTTDVYVEETRFAELASITRRVEHMPPEIEHAIATLWTVGATPNGCCTFQCVAYCTAHDHPGMGYCGHRKENHIGCA